MDWGIGDGIGRIEGDGGGDCVAGMGVGIRVRR